jgi:UDP-N-acetylmuramoyl-tripeptide--D-alanyl-D-alanine ligase
VKKYIRKIIEKILTACAKVLLFRHRPIIIAITGSAGKSTTKITVGTVLQEKYKHKVLIGYGNLGTISGTPLALLNIKANILDAGSWAPFYLILLTIISILKTLWLVIWPFYFKYMVLELTADLPGDLQITSSYLKPDVSIVTNVGQSHLEYFKTIEAVGIEKSAIVKNAKSKGLVILNGNDKNVLKMEKLTKAKVEVIKVKPYLFADRVGEVVGRYFGLNDSEIKKGLSKVKLPTGRFDILKGKNNTTLIDGTYNSNPVSVNYSLEKLNSISGSYGRKIIVLGDMLELGENTAFYHEQVGLQARKIADYLVAIGPLCAHMPADFKTLSIDQAAEYLLKLIKPNDIILIKASHGMKLHRLIEKLKE